MKKLLILLLLSTSFSTFADSHLDFSLSKFCYLQPDVQDRGGVYYFANEEVGITATSICVYKDAYGQYSSKGELINGKKDGEWKHWNQNGEVLEENYYVDGETGTVACNRTDGIKLDGIYYDVNNEEPFTGRNLCKYENGQINIQGNYKDGKRNGKWTFWYENGQIEAEGNFKDGKLDGKWTSWHENGQKYSEANFKKSTFEGVDIVVRDGKFTVWYESGQKGGEVNYKDDKLDGKWTEWYESGQIKAEKHYKDGDEDGKFTDWYENGQKSWERTIKDGWFDGKVTKWYYNGQVKSEKLYANEKCISGDCD